MVSKSNYKESDYIAGGAVTYVLRDKMLFCVTGGPKYPIITCGVTCGINPAYLLAPNFVYLGIPTCGAVGQSSGWHLEGVVLVPDYKSVAVLPDGGMLFDLKPPWLSHFLGVVAFAPIPLPPI